MLHVSFIAYFLILKYQQYFVTNETHEAAQYVRLSIVLPSIIPCHIFLFYVVRKLIVRQNRYVKLQLFHSISLLL